MNVELIRAIADLLWPVIVIVALLKLWPHIFRITKEATEVKLKVGNYELSSSRQTSEVLIKPVLNEIDEAITGLSPEQKAEFRRIYNHIEVEGREFEIAKDFERDSTYHHVLRALRNVGFIKPFGGGNWQVGKQIRIKNIGRLAVKLRPKELGFSF